jgi:DNA-binding transcriptional LysR family regulator
MASANLDLDLLRTFVAVCDLRNFTRAAERLGRTQSAVSLQVRRLEQRMGCSLLLRDPRHVALTADGETLLPRARRMLRLNDEILAENDDKDFEGEVRLGAPEDFATAYLPEILGDFARSHPRVSLTVTCDLTLNLMDRLRDGALDLALIKREPIGPDLGVRVWREALVWVAADAGVADGDAAIPLVLAPSPCVYRRRAVEALDREGRAWRAAYTSPSLAGQLAALRAGLGATVLPRDMAPPDLAVIGADSGLPILADAEIALLRASGGLPRAAEKLAEYVLGALDRRHSGSGSPFSRRF